MMSLSAGSRCSLGLTFLIGVMLISQTASGQVITPAGVRGSSPNLLLTPCRTCSETSLAGSYEPDAAFGLGHSRKVDALIGLVAGAVIGFEIGKGVAHRDANRCKSSCEVPFEGVNEMLDGSVIGALLGTVVGALWPVRE
jgi:hypothetical protein